MRRILLIVFAAVGVVCLMPDSANAQLFWRRRARRASDDCGCGTGYGGGYGYGGGAYASGYASDCGCGGYATMPYGGQPMMGYEGQPMPYGGMQAGYNQYGQYGPQGQFGPQGQYGPPNGQFGPQGGQFGPQGGPPYSAGYPNPNTGGPQPMPSPTNAQIVIRDNGFEPSRINVSAGQSIRWTNDSTHAVTVTAENGSWDSGKLEPGKTFSHTFDSPGSYGFHLKENQQVKGTTLVGPGIRDRCLTLRDNETIGASSGRVDSPDQADSRMEIQVDSQMEIRADSRMEIRAALSPNRMEAANKA